MNETFSTSDENIQKLTDISINYSKIISNIIEEIKKILSVKMMSLRKS